MFRKVLIYILYFYITKKINAFNLSPVPSFILKEPKNVTTQTYRNNSSYFGYSLILREESIIIGAPRGLTEYNVTTMIESGVVYQYIFSKRSMKPLIFKNTLSKHNDIHIKNQWLGASMDGGRKDTEKFIACAPRVIRIFNRNNSTLDYMNGVCYMAKNSLSSKLDNVIINPLARSDMQMKWSLNSNERESLYQYGEQGISVHLTPNSDEFLIGAPGAFEWRGTVVRFNAKTEISNIPEMNSAEFSYGGYAVASGYLDSVKRQQILYLITLPHGDNVTQLGEAFILNFGRGAEIKKLQKLIGQQYGEFFGYAALVDDVNADGLDDILISAPQHSINERVDVGVVYVFINRGAFNFERQVIQSPFGEEGRFGTTMSTMGDINLDGYNDIAIGAPFDAGTGSVAIFLGSATGLRSTPSQIITSATKTLPNGMFGFGLSKGVDIDQNGFNDLAVGAPEADHVFIYQAYPVVKINASIKAIPAEIPLTSKRNDTQKLQIQVCYNIITNSTKLKETEIVLNIDLDNKLKRISLNAATGARYHLEKVVSAKRHPICENFTATIKPQTQLNVIPMELQYKLQNDARLYNKSEFCKTCAIVDPTYAKMLQGTIKYKHNCNSADCFVDLAVCGIDMLQHYTLGTSTNITIIYEITNAGDNAYNTQIEIKTNLNLPIAQIPSDCDIQFLDTELSLICDLAKASFLKENLLFEVSFDVSNIIDANSLQIAAAVSSSGTEKQESNNKIINHIEIYKNLTIEITGRPKETFVTLEKLVKNTQMKIDYKIQNSGPSPLARFHLWTLLPVAYKNIQFINITNTQVNIVMDNYHHLPITFNTPQSEAHLISDINIKDYDIANYSLPNDRINILDCARGKSIQCAESYKVLPYFKPGQNLTLTLTYDIIIKAVTDIMTDPIDYLAIMPHVIIKASSAVQSEITTKLEPIIIVNIERKTPLWIYLISSLGGLIFLIILALALKKMGFFKRQTKEDMEKIVNEKIEKAIMKKEIERATSIEEDYTDRTP